MPPDAIMPRASQIRPLPVGNLRNQSPRYATTPAAKNAMYCVRCAGSAGMTHRNGTHLSTGYHMRTSHVINASATTKEAMTAWLGKPSFVGAVSDGSEIRRNAA